jgi:hypothetical protein
MHRPGRAALWGVGAAAVTAIVGAMFAGLGVVNGDEGWYVISARLVGEGKLPYRDFAFTQGPVYSYLLAPFVSLAPGVYTARAVSVVCAAVAIGLLIAMARRVAGKWAAIASAAALLAAIPSLPYWLSITKTYALSCLFLAAILFTLTSALRPAIRFPLGAALAVAFAETRTSGVALAAFVVAVLIARSPDPKIRVRVVLATAAALVPFVTLVLLEWTRAKWGLIDYHQLGSHGDSGIGRFFSRTFAAAEAWPGVFVLGIAASAVAVLDPAMRARMKRRPELTAVALGIVAFLLVHEAGGAFFSVEYLAPLVAPVLVVSCVMLVRAATGMRATSRRKFVALRALLVAGIAVTAIGGGHNYYLGAPGWRGNPAATKAVARCVQKHSAPRDRVFALSLEEVVVEAHRQPVPNVTLGPFSYQDVTTKRAQELKILNSSRLAAMFSLTPPKILVVTVDDIFETQRAGYFSRKKVTNLAVYFGFKKYRPVCRKTLIRHVFHNSPVVVTVYARKS